MTDQLSLWAEPPIAVHTVCEKCGARAIVEVQPGETWQPAILWGLLALWEHRREVHADG